MKTQTIDIVFDGPPGPEAGRFVEVHDAMTQAGAGNIGTWIKPGDDPALNDDYWRLRIEAVVP